MSSSGLQERWKSEEYKNHLKVINALLYLRDGLGPFCEHTITDFQSGILGKHKISQKECTKKTCTAKNIKKGKLQPECLDICSLLLRDIFDEHRKPTIVYWENSQIRKWSVNAWEIAKVYMGRGQKMDNNGPQKSDSAAILQLLSNCKQFGKYTNCGEVEKLSQRRNAAMHSSTLSCTCAEMKEALTMMIDFLKKLIPKLSAERDIEPIKKTIDKLTELKNTEFEIFLKNNKKSPHEEEMKIFHEIITDHENRLNGLEELKEKVEEIKAVIPLLEMMQRNPDLMAHLDDGYQNLISLSQLDERTSALTEMTEATASRVADVEEDLVDLRKKVEALASPDKTRSQVTNYKGQLKNFLDSKRISVPAKYNPKPDPTSLNKWSAKVTVILGSEPMTFDSPSSCQRIIDAEHSAAFEAYQYLREHEELFTKCDTLTAGEDPREKLDEVLEKFGFAKATYRDRDEKKFNGSGKNFTASVTVNVRGIIQKKLDDPNMTQADRQQAVATEALKAIGQEVADSAKNTLYGWCGRNKHTVPKYYPESPKEPSYIHVISSAFREKHEVEVESSWCPSKKDAKRSAADLMLRLVEETRLTDIWRSTCQSNTDSVSTAAVKPNHSSDKHDEPKAEARALEKIRAVPTMADSSSNCDDLRSLCEKLGLNLPQFKIVRTKENQFQVELMMDYIFQPNEGLQFKNKAEAENEAAKTVLTILMTDKTPQQDNKNYKSQLNEFCQKQGIKNNVPQYITTGSGTNFHSQVKVQFVELCSENFRTESEACDFAAKAVLRKLGLSKNHFEILKKHCTDRGLEVPTIDYKSSPAGEETFCVVLNMIYVFNSERPHQIKKEAEKSAACHALKVLYPDVDCSDLNKCKNLLQEKTPSTLPTYDAEKLENGQFTAKATVCFQMQGNSWHSNKEDALNEVAKKFLEKINRFE